ncbi:MAG TPA: exodeoxyribonuclease III, partial [Gammaproteobacteria bacterium]
MRIASWNVNSLRARLDHVRDWLESARPDLLCVQETKVVDADFPAAALAEAGYAACFSGQKSYNGVALLARDGLPLGDVVSSLTGEPDEPRRFLAASVAGVRVVNVYVPNGSAVGSDKYAYKLAWLERLVAALRAELAAQPRLLLLGDYNIAPADRDVHDPDAWRDQVLCSVPERAAFAALTGLGLVDLFRAHHPDAVEYTWWDYRLNAYRRNLGLRIDHLLASPALAATCRECTVDRTPRGWERPSDHAP